MAAASIRGIQSRGMIATAKHYIDNDQEYQRDSISVVIDNRTQHEIYLLPFKTSVQVGVGSAMCAYNRINGVYACENAATQNSLLKRESEPDTELCSGRQHCYPLVEPVQRSPMDYGGPGGPFQHRSDCLELGGCLRQGVHY